MEEVGCVVAGAGVVGLAIARALARRGHEVLVLEAARAPGLATSARNSGVIHAGLYYPPGSLRAALSVAGRRMLYAYCAEKAVAAPKLGKLVVATTEAEEAELAAIHARAHANGVEGLRLLSGAEARAMEPALACTAALLSPETGIVDAHGLMLALRGDAEDAGAVIASATPLARAEVTSAGFTVRAGGAEPLALQARFLVNAAGLGAVPLARAIAGLDPAHVPPAYFAKGSYFALAGRAPFRRLIYPVPIPGGAGIHLTLDLAGAARFGPDVDAVDAIDYAVDPARAALFYPAIRRYWPGLPDGALHPDYAGIRPKIVPAEQSADFRIDGEAVHGIPGLVNLFGIESPGLTASLAIAEHVAGLLGA